MNSPNRMKGTGIKNHIDSQKSYCKENAKEDITTGLLRLLRYHNGGVYPAIFLMYWRTSPIPSFPQIMSSAFENTFG